MRVVILILHATAIGAIAAALFALELSIPSKVIIGALGISIAIALRLLADTLETLQKTYVYSRLTFISTEMARLDRGSREKAKDRFASDITAEGESQRVGELLTGGAATSLVFGILYAAVAIAACAIFYLAWGARVT